MHALEDTMLTAISGSLLRKSVTRCSRWAEKYRVMGKPYPGPWSFVHHPWTKEIHDSASPGTVIQKAAQMGLSETMLNIVFFNIDIKGNNCLYILPNKSPDATDFSSSRFDAALELSTHLATLFSDAKNVGLKRAGSVSLFVRGSRSRSGLKSVPAPIIVFDEFDEMPMDNVPLALERGSGQDEDDIRVYYLSTPTVDNFGINAKYLDTTREHFHFRCPHCSRFTELIFPDSLIINDSKIENSYIICKECKHPLAHDAKPEFLANNMWVPERSDSAERGFYINQLYSCAVPPHKIASLAVKAQTDPAAEQELFNSKMGMPRVVEGARLTDVVIDSCIGGHKNEAPLSGNGYCTIGIDVGKWFHYWVDMWFDLGTKHNDINLDSMCRTLAIGRVKDTWELDAIMHKYNPIMAIIDANPERRAAMDFANRWTGHVNLCYYGRGNAGKNIREPADSRGYEVTVDRTSWLDLSQGRFRRGRNNICLPVDVPLEAREHLKALVRRYETDDQGNPVGRYINVGADHYAHARNYSEIALQVGLKFRVGMNTTVGA